MKALYIKLTVLFFLFFGLAVYVVNVNQKQEKTPTKQSLYNQIKAGEWYGSLSISDLISFQSQVPDSLLNKYFFDITAQELIQERLKNLGLRNSTIYFSGCISTNEVTAYIPLEKPSDLAKDLASIGATLDWGRIDTLEQTIYNTNQNNIHLLLTSQVLILTNSNEHNSHFVEKSDSTRFVSLDSLFKTPNMFAIQIPKMEALGINYIDAIFNFTYPLRVNGTVKTLAPFPFTSGKASSVLEQPNLNYQAGSSISIDTALFTASWYALFDQWQSNYGFPFASFLKRWDGTSSFAMGGDVIQNDTIVTYGFDDNFNETETKKIVKKKVTGFSLLLGSKTPDNLVVALRENNFLSFEKGTYFFPMSPPLFIQNRTDQVELSSSDHSQLNYKKKKYSFYIDAFKEGWFIHANIDRKSSERLEYEVSAGVLEK